MTVFHQTHTLLLLFLMLSWHVHFPANGFGLRQTRRRCHGTFSVLVRHATTVSADNDTNDSYRHAVECNDDDDFTILQKQLGYVPPNLVRVVARTAHHNLPVAIQTYPLHGGAPRRQAKVGLPIGAPFPTLYWLTEPAIARAIANLERQGYVGRIEERIRQNATLVAQLSRCHEEYAHERWTSLEEADRTWLVEHPSSATTSMVAILRESGIAGTNLTRIVEQATERRVVDSSQNEETPPPVVPTIPSLKCLHTHYAHYRAILQKNQDAVSMHTGDANNKKNTLQLSLRTLNPVGEMVHEQLLLDNPELDL